MVQDHSSVKNQVLIISERMSILISIGFIAYHKTYVPMIVFRIMITVHIKYTKIGFDSSVVTE
jgi:hypothetical protein